jgi:hypothetical protein
VEGFCDFPKLILREKHRVQRLFLVATLVLIFAVAGCAKDSASLVAPSANEIIPYNKTASVARPAKKVVPTNLSPEVRAEALEGASESKKPPLMECMSEACKIECSPNVTKQSKPKWCSFFKEPIS